MILGMGWGSEFGSDKGPLLVKEKVAKFLTVTYSGWDKIGDLRSLDHDHFPPLDANWTPRLCKKLKGYFESFWKAE